MQQLHRLPTTKYNSSSMNAKLSARILVETIGTFLLAFTIQMVVLHVPDLAFVAPLAIALVLTALVYAGGPISGAMYNPAIVMVFALARDLPRRDWIPYLFAQFIAAAAAAGLALILRGSAETTFAPNLMHAWIAECVFTFALAWIILQATSRRNDGNQWYGMAIGFIVGAGAWAVGAVSGAAFNPAVWLSLAITDKLAWSSWWIYVSAEVLAVVLAVVCQRIIESGEPPCDPISPS